MVIVIFNNKHSFDLNTCFFSITSRNLTYNTYTRDCDNDPWPGVKSHIFRFHKNTKYFINSWCKSRIVLFCLYYNNYTILWYTNGTRKLLTLLDKWKKKNVTSNPVFPIWELLHWKTNYKYYILFYTSLLSTFKTAFYVTVANNIWKVNWNSLRT